MNKNYTYNNGYAVDSFGNRIDTAAMNKVTPVGTYEKRVEETIITNVDAYGNKINQGMNSAMTNANYAVDSYGNRMDQAMMNMNNMNTYPVNPNMNTPVYNTHGVGSSYSSGVGAGYATGTQKVVIKENADGYVSKEKASLHDPMTGISEKVKTKSKGKRDSSSSSEKRRRNNNINYTNTSTYPTNVPVGTTYPSNMNQNYPMNVGTTYPNNMNMGTNYANNMNTGYANQGYEHHGMAPLTTATVPLEAPIVRDPLAMHNQT